MNFAPAFNDRVEKKFQLGIEEAEVATLWRDLRSLLKPYGFEAAQEITSVGSVYFDNKDCDLLRFTLFGHLMLFRTRVYELYGRTPEPISQYWVEVKTAQGARRRKRRFPLSKAALFEFLEGKEWSQQGHQGFQIYDPEFGQSYRASQETVLTMGLKPTLLVKCKRVAFQGETARISIDWDVEYYSAATNIYNFNSWKYLGAPFIIGKAGKVILELKCLRDEGVPAWFAELSRHYEIWQREYLKPVEGMKCLFEGPMKEHKEAKYFLPLINAYMQNSLLG